MCIFCQDSRIIVLCVLCFKLYTNYGVTHLNFICDLFFYCNKGQTGLTHMTEDNGSISECAHKIGQRMQASWLSFCPWMMAETICQQGNV